MNAIHIIRNAIDYPLRRFFHWRRRGLRLFTEPKEGLFNPLPPEDRLRAERLASRLLIDYQLDYLYTHSRADNYRENLFYLELILRALDAADSPLPSPLAAADIGPSHWFYVHALHAALSRWRSDPPRSLWLTAYEADAYRVYGDLYSRFDHALAHMAGLENVNYLPHAFASQPNRFNVITLFFPFVFVRDHLEWGLPQSHFAPGQLLRDAWASLESGGLLIIVNQGEAEHNAQIELLRAASIAPLAAFRHDSLLYQYDLPRFVITARRND